jgi:hypothetical protein
MEGSFRSFTRGVILVTVPSWICSTIVFGEQHINAAGNACSRKEPSSGITNISGERRLKAFGLPDAAPFPGRTTWFH